MECPQCNHPLPEGAATCERCSSVPLPAPLPPARIEGRVEIDHQTGGIAAGVNVVQNQYVGPVHQHYSGAPSPPPVLHSLKGQLSLHVPARNPFFTGRSEELVRLRTFLEAVLKDGTWTPQALQGLGGIGKTAMACEYAHRYRQEYEGVFWVVGETPQQLASQLAALAPELVPPVPTLPNQEDTLQQVRAWFAGHVDWLLIVDNAVNLPRLAPLLPPSATGTLLLTTRDLDTGVLAEIVEVGSLDEVTGALLLLRRANKLTHAQPLDTVDAAWQEGAKAISREVDGLPLALDQAGAYIRTRGVTPQQYLAFYRKRHQELHADYVNPNHVSVSVTFSLALEQVEQIPKYGPAARELAQLCAFLAPDAIPDEVFLTSSQFLPEALAAYTQEEIDFVEVCEAACRYALLRRATDPSGLSMHRLVQEVLRDRLKADERQAMAERAVRAVNVAFPFPEFPTWALCERLIDHASACARSAAEYGFDTVWAAHLSQNAGAYLLRRGRYEEAEVFLKGALAIRSKIHGPDAREVATALNNLGMLYLYMHRTEEAADCLQQAVTLDAQREDIEDIEVATQTSHLDNLAQVRYQQDRFEEAAKLREQAVRLEIRARGPHHPNVALRLHNLALVYIEMHRYEEAEGRLSEAREIARAAIGEHDPGYASILITLGSLYIHTGHPDTAESLLRQALGVFEAVHPPMRVDIAHCCYWLGGARARQGSIQEAADLFQRAWEIRLEIFGPEHPNTRAARINLDEAQRLLDAKNG